MLAVLRRPDGHLRNYVCIMRLRGRGLDVRRADIANSSALFVEQSKCQSVSVRIHLTVRSRGNESNRANRMIDVWIWNCRHNVPPQNKRRLPDHLLDLCARFLRRRTYIQPNYVKKENHKRRCGLNRMHTVWDRERYFPVLQDVRVSVKVLPSV